MKLAGTIPDMLDDDDRAHVNAAVDAVLTLLKEKTRNPAEGALAAALVLLNLSDLADHPQRFGLDLLRSLYEAREQGGLVQATDPAHAAALRAARNGETPREE